MQKVAVDTSCDRTRARLGAWLDSGLRVTDGRERETLGLNILAHQVYCMFLPCQVMQV